MPLTTRGALGERPNDKCQCGHSRYKHAGGKGHCHDCEREKQSCPEFAQKFRVTD